MALPHRTQILYLADIAFITAHLNITCGSRVIEAGLYPSHRILLNQSIPTHRNWFRLVFSLRRTHHRFIRPSLVLRISRAQSFQSQVCFHFPPPQLSNYQCREEFARHGMNDIVTLTHRNVCKDGFTVSDTVDSGNPLLLHPSTFSRTFPQCSLISPRPGKPSNMPKKPCGYEILS